MNQPAEYRCFAVVLAAGQSRRFGANKQLQKLDGQPLVGRAAALARSVCGENTLLVAGHEWRRVVAAADQQCQFVAINENFGDGIGTSIAVAAKSLTQTADCILILLADQPLISEDHLHALLSAWSGDDEEIVATAFAGTQGPPVLMPRGAFSDLARLVDDTGARTLLGNPHYRLTTVCFDAAAIDIDSPDDLDRLT